MRHTGYITHIHILSDDAPIEYEILNAPIREVVGQLLAMSENIGHNIYVQDTDVGRITAEKMGAEVQVFVELTAPPPQELEAAPAIRMGFLFDPRTDTEDGQARLPYLLDPVNNFPSDEPYNGLMVRSLNADEWIYTIYAAYPFSGSRDKRLEAGNVDWYGSLETSAIAGQLSWPGKGNRYSNDDDFSYNGRTGVDGFVLTGQLSIDTGFIAERHTMDLTQAERGALVDQAAATDFINEFQAGPCFRFGRELPSLTGYGFGIRQASPNDTTVTTAFYNPQAAQPFDYLTVEERRYDDANNDLNLTTTWDLELPKFGFRHWLLFNQSGDRAVTILALIDYVPAEGTREYVVEIYFDGNDWQWQVIEPCHPVVTGPGWQVTTTDTDFNAGVGGIVQSDPPDTSVPGQITYTNYHLVSNSYTEQTIVTERQNRIVAVDYVGDIYTKATYNETITETTGSYGQNHPWRNRIVEADPGGGEISNEWFTVSPSDWADPGDVPAFVDLGFQYTIESRSRTADLVISGGMSRTIPMGGEEEDIYVGGQAVYGLDSVFSVLNTGLGDPTVRHRDQIDYTVLNFLDMRHDHIIMERVTQDSSGVSALVPDTLVYTLQYNFDVTERRRTDATLFGLAAASTGDVTGQTQNGQNLVGNVAQNSAVDPFNNVTPVVTGVSTITNVFTERSDWAMVATLPDGQTAWLEMAIGFPSLDPAWGGDGPWDDGNPATWRWLQASVGPLAPDFAEVYAAMQMTGNSPRYHSVRPIIVPDDIIEKYEAP